jgi:hypothetical protein
MFTYDDDMFTNCIISSHTSDIYELYGAYIT